MGISVGEKESIFLAEEGRNCHWVLEESSSYRARSPFFSVIFRLIGKWEEVGRCWADSAGRRENSELVRRTDGANNHAKASTQLDEAFF
jgi:hypothetical protein